MRLGRNLQPQQGFAQFVGKASANPFCVKAGSIPLGPIANGFRDVWA